MTLLSCLALVFLDPATRSKRSTNFHHL